MTESTPVAVGAVTSSALSGDWFEWWAGGRSIRRDFWRVTAIFVGGEAAILFCRILFNGVPDSSPLARTLLSGLLCSWTALAGFALVTRGWLPRYARASIILSALAFPLLVAFIWVSGSNTQGAWSKLHWSTVIVLVSALLLSSQRLWLDSLGGSNLKRIAFAVTAISITVVALDLLVALWRWHISAGAARLLGSFLFLTFACFVINPILRRALRNRG